MPPSYGRLDSGSNGVRHMNASKLIAIALTALLITAGAAAAAPGQAPDDAGADAADVHQPDDPGADAAENASDNETDADVERDENASDAPPTEMPEQVPDHVTQIHELIRDKLSGDLGNTSLGEAISGVVGSGDDAQANSQADSADEQSENANEASENGQSDTANAGVTGDLPEQAADHVSAIHDAITSFLDGDGDSNPGDEVSGIASG